MSDLVLLSDFSAVRDATTRDDAVKLATSILCRLQNGSRLESIAEHLRCRHSFDCVAELIPPKKRLAIVAYPIPKLGKWDPAHMQGAGSEEALMYMGNILARDWEVTIFADPPEDSWWKTRLSNPQFLPTSELADCENEFDTIIGWRHVPKEVYRYGKRFYLWLHDAAYAYPEKLNADGIFYLTQHHQKSYERYNYEWRSIRSVVAGNGIHLEKLPSQQIARKPKSCIYASNYARGLIHLLRIWPRVLEKFPEATLHVAYGRETWGNLNESQLNDIVTLLDQPGIQEHGKLNETQLYELFASCSFWTYPYSGKSETFCITAIKAQACGCIPITTREAALAETVAPMAFTQERLEVTTYSELLLQTLSMEESIDRQPFIDFASQFTWERVYQHWNTLLLA